MNGVVMIIINTYTKQFLTRFVVTEKYTFQIFVTKVMRKEWGEGKGGEGREEGRERGWAAEMWQSELTGERGRESYCSVKKLLIIILYIQCNLLFNCSPLDYSFNIMIVGHSAVVPPTLTQRPLSSTLKYFLKVCQLFNLQMWTTYDILISYDAVISLRAILII